MRSGSGCRFLYEKVSGQQLILNTFSLDPHSTISGYVPTITLDLQEFLHNRKLFSVTDTIILVCHTSIILDCHVHTKFSENRIQIPMGLYKYRTILAKPRVGIVGWLKSIVDFWIFNHVTTVSRFFSTKFCEKEFLAILPHSPLYFNDHPCPPICNIFTADKVNIVY